MSAIPLPVQVRFYIVTHLGDQQLQHLPDCLQCARRIEAGVVEKITEALQLPRASCLLFTSLILYMATQLRHVFLPLQDCPKLLNSIQDKNDQQ